MYVKAVGDGVLDVPLSGTQGRRALQDGGMHSPYKGHYLGSAALQGRGETVIAGAGGYTLGQCPHDRIMKPCVIGHILKDIVA